MPQLDYLVIIAGMGLVTFLPRWAPLAILSRRRLPDWLLDGLDLIPAAVLSALVLPAIVTTGETRSFSLLQPELLVAIPTFLFALKTKIPGRNRYCGHGALLAGRKVPWINRCVLCGLSVWKYDIFSDSRFL